MRWLYSTTNYFADYISRRFHIDVRQRVRRQQSNTFDFESLEPRQVLTALPGFAPDTGILYQIRGVTGEQGQLSEIDLVQGTFVDVGENAGFKINGTGFRVADGYIYGVKMDTDELIRLGSDGGHEVLGAIEGLPNGNYFTGDFGKDGRLYLRHQNQYFGVNVDELAVERVVTASENVTKTYDIAYNPVTELHYSVRKVGQKSQFISIDLTSDSETAVVDVINDDFEPSGTYGALFSDASGRVFAANNKGGLYEVDLESGIAEFAGHTPRASSNDGALSSAAYVNLPPIAIDSWFSTLAGEPAQPLAIDAPYDLEDQDLQVRVAELPDTGTILLADGSNVHVNQLLTVDELTSLYFQAPQNIQEATQSTQFVYTVSDGVHTSEAITEISFAGLSRITGSVIIVDDTEESAYDGYAFNNEIRITGTNFRGDDVNRTVLTDVNGNYIIEDLAPGNYQISQLQPSVVIDGYVDPQALSTSGDGDNTVEFEIGPTPSSIEGPVFYDFAPAVFSGFVYVDANGNGQVDATETGLREVVIEITGIDEHGSEFSHSTTTDSYGFYEFRGLAPGTYAITQQQPEDYLNARSNVGTVGGLAADNRISGIEIGPGQIGSDYDFGEYEKSSISGTAFLDNDSDKVFDQGDTALNDVRIQLDGFDVNGNSVFLQTTTDENGLYVFENLVAGTYNITEEQPQDLEDGVAHIGIFNNDESVLPTNGTAGENQIIGIELGFGRHGRSFDFSETVNYHFTNYFDQSIVFSGTDLDDQFEFRAGELYHTVLVNGQQHQIDASLRTNFYFDGLGGNDTILITGSDSVERVVTDGYSATMRSEYWRVETVNGEQFMIDSGGGYDRAFMYDTADDDRIKMTQDYARQWNDNYTVETRGYHRTYAYADNGGNDRAYLYDSKYDDTVKMTDENARMISRKFYNFAGGFERTYAYSINGGKDRAQFWDSELDQDIFQGTPEYSRMYNDGAFYNFAEGFYQVDVFAYGGGTNDRAFLFGSNDDEILIASPRKSGMVGNGFKYDAHGFERMYAISNGGNDRALLFDSKLDDRFVAKPDDARLYNDSYFINAKEFAVVDAFSSKGGNDRAYFYDSSGDDTLVTLDNKMRIFGEGFDNTSHGFARAYAHATAGGNDLAILFDTEQADTVNLSNDLAKMYGETYYSWLNGFENVEAMFTNANQHDRALVFGSINEETIELSGDLADLIYDHGNDFIYDVDADETQSEDNDDSDLLAMFEDLANLS